MSVNCLILPILNIVAHPPNGMHSVLWGVYPALPDEYLESVPSAEAAKHLSGRKSRWMQLGLALLTEAILMFYWFFDLFFSAPASIYTLSLYLRHKEQPKPPSSSPKASVPIPVYPHPALPEQGCRTRVLMMIVRGVWFWLNSSFTEWLIVWP